MECIRVIVILLATVIVMPTIINADNNEMEQTVNTEVQNLALGKAAQQSSTYSDYYKAEKAVDGDLATYPCTKTAIAWWRVDMGKSAIIYKVRVYPWAGYFGSITKTTVTIGNNVDEAMTSCGMFTWESGQRQREGKDAYDVTCTQPLVGRYVQLNKNSDNGCYLEMYEFEAYGRYI